MIPLVKRPRSSTLLVELTRAGVLTNAELVSSVVEFEDVSMSHAAYRLVIDGEVRAFVKQFEPGRRIDRDLGSEAALYRLAKDYPALAGVVPACHALAPDDSFVVLEAVQTPPTGSAWSLSGQIFDGVAGTSSMRMYGAAVAAVHSVCPEPFGQPPWMLYGIPSAWGDDPSVPPEVGRFFRRIARTPVFRRGFDVALAEWQMTTLIHGDLRWSNVLPPADDVAPMRLVDWELACLGDPAWDIGSVLADVIGSSAVTSRSMMPQDRLVELVGPFLDEYRGERRLPDGMWRSLLVRSARCAGARLVQTLSEYGHVDPFEMQALEPILLPWSEWLIGQPEHLAAELDSLVPT